MSVLVLQYHATPVDAETQFDVPFKHFKEQIDRLIDCGASFIPFARVSEPELLSGKRHVAITFDDGHRSNAAAVEYLATFEIRPTLFIVRRWSETGVGAAQRRGYLRPADLREMSDVTSLGAHGLTHVGFSHLAGISLDHELSASKDFLGNIVGRETSELALPGGDGNIPSVLSQCRGYGFTTIGNSIVDINTKLSASYARPVIMSRHNASYPARLAVRNNTSWSMLRAARWAKQIIRAR